MLPNKLIIDPNSEPAPPAFHAAEVILPNLRGACVTVDGKVHTLFRLSGRPRPQTPAPTDMPPGPEAEPVP